MNETINPANGALSIRIEATRPHERGLNLPLYAFMYDSDNEYQVIMWENTLNCYSTSLQTLLSRTTTCIASVIQPALSNSAQWQGAIAWNAGPNTMTYGTNSYTWYNTNVMIANCVTASGYVYEDFEGVRHPLGITAILNGQSNDLGGDQRGICNQYFDIQAAPFGGDATYKVMVDDVDTHFFSPGGMQITDSVGDSLGTAAEAETPEDSNGNCMNGTGRSGLYVGYTSGDSATCDTPTVAGSPVGSGPGTYSVTYPGTANPYTYTKQNTTMTYAVGYQDITPTGDPLCYGNTQQGGSNSANSFPGSYTTPLPGSNSAQWMEKVTALGLPNGLSYTFQYDPVFGYINKITYPTGAWVEYTWGVNPNAEMMGFQSAWGMNSNIEPVDVTAGSYMNQSCWFRHDFPVITKKIVSYDGVTPAQEQDFAYATVWANTTSTNWTSKATTVTTIDLIRPGHPSFKTIYNYLPGFVTPSFGSHTITSGMSMENTVVYQDTAGNVLHTIQKVWTDSSSTAQLAGECNILPNGSVSGTFYSYAPYPNTGFPNESISNVMLYQTNEISDLAEFDYGSVTSTCTKPSTTPARETVTTYASFPNTPNWPSVAYNTNGTDVTYNFPNMWGKPSTIKLYDHGVLLSETDLGYDETVLTSVRAPYSHDEVNYGVGGTWPRGNATTIRKQCFIGSVTCPNAVTKIGYDTTGQPVLVTDSNGNQTSLSYIDNYTTDDGSPPGNTNTYVTNIVRPSVNGIAHTSSYQYDFNNGELRKATDENQNSVSYQYNDPWNRLTQSNFPDGGQASLTYYDSGPTPTVKTSRLLNSGQSMTAAVVMDGVGHTVETQLTSDPSGTDYVDTTYDGLGLPFTVSNPYRAGDTQVTTQYTYDSLGRSTKKVEQDGSTIQWCYNNIASTGQTNCAANSSSVPTASWVDQTDEAGLHWQHTSDALGHLVAVMEPHSVTGILALETDYGYDAVGDLLSVTQKGTSGDTTRTRNFSYDSLSRLVSSTNAETGKMSYLYVSNNNLCAGDPSLPCSKLDARGITTNYSYDALNRLLSKTYSVGTPSSCYQYDQVTGGGSGSNLIGRLTNSWTQTGSACPSAPPSAGALARHSYLAYDPMGRLTSEQQCTVASCGHVVYSPSYSYDLAGNVITHSSGIPSGAGSFIFTNSFDTAGRLSTVTSNNTLFPTALFTASQTTSSAGCNAVSSPGYNSAGGLQNAIFGVGLQLTRSYDDRLRVNCETDIGNSALNPTLGTAKIIINGTDLTH